MKLSYLLPNLVAGLLLVATSVLAVPQSVAPDSRAKCDASRAYSILSTLSTGSAFCSTLLFPHGDGTKTTATTKTVSRKTCSTETKTKTTPYTFTELIYKTLTLPVVTLTEYSSTVLVPSGTHAPVNKRSPQIAAAAANSANRPAPNHTPAQLSTCPADTITRACSSLVTKPTITTTLKSTIYPCTTTTKTTDEQDFTTSVKVHSTFTVSPPPIIISAPSSITHTTTVPAACAGGTYGSGGYVGDGNGVFPYGGYPYFSQTGVECCVLCYEIENCIASAFISDADDCQLFIRVNGTETGTGFCSEGIYDYPFGPGDPESNIYPGPCGV